MKSAGFFIPLVLGLSVSSLSNAMTSDFGLYLVSRGGQVTSALRTYKCHLARFDRRETYVQIQAPPDEYSKLENEIFAYEATCVDVRTGIEVQIVGHSYNDYSEGQTYSGPRALAGADFYSKTGPPVQRLPKLRPNEYLLSSGVLSGAEPTPIEIWVGTAPIL